MQPTFGAISITPVLEKLFSWAKERGFAGHDPHDMLNAPAARRLRWPLGRIGPLGRMGRRGPLGPHGRLGRLARLAAVQVGRRSAVDLHRMLRVPRMENPKALALFLTGLLHAKEAAAPNWEEEAALLGVRLCDLLRPEGGWGYPFPWQSRTHFLPRNTPNIVTTSFAGMALMDWRNTPGHARCPEAVQQTVLHAIETAANWTMEAVPHLRPNGVAFGYAAEDPQIVFNASLLGAEFLMQAGFLLNSGPYVDLASQAAHFVAAHQSTDGSWNYGLEASQTWIDSFHTGFVIVSLKHIASTLHDDALLHAAQRGFAYYRKTFLESDGAVAYYSDRRFPIDAHSLGQAMVTLCEFGDVDTALRVAEWSIRNMRSPEGYFYYQKHRSYTNRIPYMRWSNAWMFRGLAEPGIRKVHQ